MGDVKCSEPEITESVSDSKAAEEDNMDTEEPDEIIPPSKGYNLDFLDKLDDPNFNPFETKSGVTGSFTESAPVPGANIETNSEPSNDAQLAEEPAKPARKPLPKKPWLKNKKKTEAGESERVKKVPSKPLPPKPWLQKKSTTVTAPPAEESEITEENTTNPPEEGVEEV